MNNHEIMEKVDSFFSSAVSDFIDPQGVFKKKLLAKVAGDYKKEIIIKYGADPTRPDIHLGHAVGLRKLRLLQDLGCTVVFVIGDFTAQIGDPTGKSKVRPEIDHEAVQKNTESYLKQAGIILDTNKTKYVSLPNSVWYESISDYDGKNLADRARKWEIDRKDLIDRMPEVLNTATSPFSILTTLKKITHSRLIERDMFQGRLSSGEPLFMHEMLYPVLQAIDSVVIARLLGSCDLEIGGTDQTFNMLMGRDVMVSHGLEPQAVMSLDLLVGLDGKEKMSKSLANYVGITDSSEDMYGKIMSLPDNTMPVYFEYVLGFSKDESRKIEKEISSGSNNPRDTKMRLAREIVSLYHSEKEALVAEKAFVDTFSKGGVPEDIETVFVSTGTSLSVLFVETKVVKSKTEFRRLVEEGAITNLNTGEKVNDPAVLVGTPAVYKIGKRRFLKIEIV